METCECLPENDMMCGLVDFNKWKFCLVSSLPDM
jgi:hypothetical protein